MNNFLKTLILLITFAGGASATAQIIRSTWADSAPPLDTNSTSSFWQGSPPVYMDADTHGNRDPKYRTEIRTRWTKQNLYFLFVCPYEQLYLKPNPNPSAETNQLWNWDVAEIFIGSDFSDIRRYKEFEISPQAEWVDLDIDLDNPQHENGWKWNSRFAVSARIDNAARVWYACYENSLLRAGWPSSRGGQPPPHQFVSQSRTAFCPASDCVASPNERELPCARAFWLAQAREVKKKRWLNTGSN